METPRFSASEEIPHQAVCWQDYGDNFWDAERVLLIDYMPHKTTITSQYYADLLEKLREAIKSKRRGKLTKGVLLLHDNAPVHKGRVAQAAIRSSGFEQITHQP